MSPIRALVLILTAARTPWTSPVRALIPILAAAAVLTGCAADDNGSDAYGNFEASEVLVSSEVSGRLVAFRVREGETLEPDQQVGLVDTVQLSLRRAQIRAQREAVRSRLGGIAAEMDVLQEQLLVAETERARIAALLEDGAATLKQMDDVAGQIRVLNRQSEAIRTRNAPVFAEIDVLNAELAVANDQIRRSRIVNPVRGTVLSTYAEVSELTAQGRPLYEIAPLDTLTLRAYVSGAQLPHIALGQSVTVLIDENENANRGLEGVISWIASDAEFTPRPIQTKEERVNLVYAFKIRVANPDGRLKIGMPGEVRFDGATNE
jgi:HlyD family secretion protein